MEKLGLPEKAQNGLKALLEKVKSLEGFSKGRLIVTVLGLLLMLGAGYMLYPKPDSGGIKVVSQEGPEAAKMEKPVSTGANAIRVQKLRNPFSPEHELRENMPEMLTMEKGRSLGAEAGLSAGIMGNGTSGAGGAAASDKGGNGTLKAVSGSSDKSAGEAGKPQLTGILLGDQENLAIFSQNGKNFSLAAGESQNGVSLISIQGEVAVIDWNGETLQLNLN